MSGRGSLISPLLHGIRVHIVELRLTDGGLRTGLQALARLVTLTEADALVVRGPLDLAVVEPLAVETRLVVRFSSGPAAL